MKHAQVQSLEILDSRAERASRSDSSEDNLWESERLQRADAAAAAAATQRQVGGIPGSTMGGGGGGGGGEKQGRGARKRATEDKWWSAEADSTARVGGSGESASWWDEGGEGARGVEPDSLPSFFNE